MSNPAWKRSTGKSQRLTGSDYRAVFRLLSDVRENRHDRPAAARLLVERLCELVGGTCGFHSVVQDWRPNGNLAIRSLTPGGAAVERLMGFLRVCAERSNLWEDPSFGEGVRLTGTIETVSFHRLMGDWDKMRRTYPFMSEVCNELNHTDHLISWYKLDERHTIEGFSIHRWDSKRLFNTREIAIARVVNQELQWLHATGRMQVALTSSSLPLRLQVVFELLLQGKAPKEIAIRLDLSVHTVRDHIRRLYERLGVDDRNELMAKFVRKGGP